MSILSLFLVAAALAPAARFWLRYGWWRRDFWRWALIGGVPGKDFSWLHGAHLGWICGIFGFAIIALFVTAMVVALSDPSVVQAIRDMKAPPEQQERIRQMLDIIHNSPWQILLGLLQSFLLFTILPACGGALGVKLLDRD